METPIRGLYERIISRDLLTLFAVALFLGAGIKMLVRDTITIGYDDYTLSQDDTLVDLNILEKELIKSGGPKHEPVPKGDTCSQEE